MEFSLRRTVAVRIQEATMNKTKSAILLTLFSLLLALLCFVCTVSFPTGNGYFNSALSLTQKSAEFGGTLVDGETYYGGGYSTVYYPEGVISAREYEETLGGIADATEQNEYRDSYVVSDSGALYFDKEEVMDGGTTVSEEFKTSFANTLNLLTKRFERFGEEGTRVEVRDEYTIQVFMPKYDSVTGSMQSVAYDTFAYTGELSVWYGASEDTATKVLPARVNKTINDYVSSASSQVAIDGTAYVTLSFTQEGREAIKNATSGAADTNGTMLIKVGDTSVITLTVGETIDQATLYVSGSYTKDSASLAGVLLSTALNGGVDNLSLTRGEMFEIPAQFGSLALTLLYVGFGVCFVGMMVFFFIRYRMLAFAHLITYLLFLFANILCLYAIPFLYLGVGSVVAFALASILLCVSNALAFEYARKEYATGKTMASSVKAGYKKCFLPVFDMHIVVAILAFIAYFIALGELSVFAFVLGLATAFSGVSTLAINRFAWAITMPFSKDKGAFCNFKREEVEDDE